MLLKQKLAYIALGGLLVLALQVSSTVMVDRASAQSGQAAMSGVKYILSVDYPLGKKGEYIEWVKSISGALQAPEEVRRITSYDNYFGASPNRFIELEFDNMGAAAKYFEQEGVRAVLEDWPNHGVNGQVHVMVLRGDYTKN